jgi:hypothetical protein
MGEQTVVHNAHEVLRKLTGQSLGPERSSWLAWYRSANGE